MYKYKHLQAGQLPWEHLPFLQNLLNFVIKKNLKQEVHDDLRVCVNERSPCGLPLIGDKDLSMSRNPKATSSMEKHPMDFYQGDVFIAQIW